MDKGNLKESLLLFFSPLLLILWFFRELIAVFFFNHPFIVVIVGACLICYGFIDLFLLKNFVWSKCIGFGLFFMTTGIVIHIFNIARNNKDN
jgi:hypothetical protein